MLRIFRHYLSTAALGLFLFEGGVIVSALYAAARLFARMDATAGASAKPYFIKILIAAIVSSLLMYSMGLYDRWLMGDFRRALPRLVVWFAVCAPVIVVSLMLNVPVSDGVTVSREALAYSLWASLVFASILVSRASYAGITRATAARRRVLVVGVGKLAAQIESFVSLRRDLDVEVVGYAALTNETPLVPRSKVRSYDASLLEIARNFSVKEIVIALDDRRRVPLQPFLEARMEGIKIIHYLSFWERETRRVDLQALDPSWLIYSDGFRSGSETNIVIKRLFDVGLSVALLIAGLPLYVLAAIAVMLSSPGPIFYKQERVGRNGSIFTIYKFRTMRVDAESNGIPQWASLQDPRTTRIGTFLRKLRIDEMPQIVNVLRGDMSFVGPRPERPFFVQSLVKEIPYYTERHHARPGITGWAQINYPYGASVEDAKAKLSYDLYYIKNYSLMFDLLIILSTARAIFFNNGAR